MEQWEYTDNGARLAELSLQAYGKYAYVPGYGLTLSASGLRDVLAALLARSLPEGSLLLRKPVATVCWAEPSSGGATVCWAEPASGGATVCWAEPPSGGATVCWTEPPSGGATALTPHAHGGSSCSSRDAGCNVSSRDDGSNFSSRDDGSNFSSRDAGSNSSSRDGGSNSSSRDAGCNVSSRDDGSNFSSRDDGSNFSSRDGGSNSSSRADGSNSSSRADGSNSSSRDGGSNRSWGERGAEVEVDRAGGRPECPLREPGGHKPVRVLCEDGEEFWADHVIVTSSVGYLKKHEAAMFQPRLPETFRRAIHQMGFGTVAKVFLVWDDLGEVLDSEVGGLQFLWLDGHPPRPPSDRTARKTKVMYVHVALFF